MVFAPLIGVPCAPFACACYGCASLQQWMCPPFSLHKLLHPQPNKCALSTPRAPPFTKLGAPLKLSNTLASHKCALTSSRLASSSYAPLLHKGAPLFCSLFSSLLFFTQLSQVRMNLFLTLLPPLASLRPNLKDQGPRSHLAQV
jgi:hypothetical protein